MLPELPPEQVRIALEQVACGVLAEAGIWSPPVDAFDVARQLGMVVAQDAECGARARFVRLGGASHDAQPAILLADDPRPERRHWAVAHEIGESVAYRVFCELGVSPHDQPAAAREQVANQLASRILLPYEWFLADGHATDWDLRLLKDRYSTASNELIARRMLEMPPAIIITLIDQGRRQWRRSNQLSRPPAMTPPELDAWRAAYESSEPTRCDRSELPDGIADVRVWPVHEPDWRREIVRTELAELW